MLRVLGVAAAAAALSVGGSAAHATHGPDPDGMARAAASVDVTALLTAAHGASPVLCALAAQSVGNGWWGNWTDAPATPLAASRMDLRDMRDSGDERHDGLADADVDRLVDALGTPDACVREIAVRLLGTQRRTARVADALVTRLTSPDVPTREVAAYGLGMVQAPQTIEPLVAALRDAAPGVRGNAAWALGRMDAGRALRPLVALFGDADAGVREAAVVATGHIDSSGTSEALVRVLEHDAAPRVRRVAAWALGQRALRGTATEALATALAHDSDAEVREMSAWAIGNSHARGASMPALAAALRSDAAPSVREMAAWALGELSDHTGLDALAQAVQADRSSAVRGTAAWAIGNMHPRGTPAPAGLLHVLKDDDTEARLKAAWALGEIGDANAAPAIRDALRAEQVPEVRRALVRALVKSGGRSEAALTELLSSSDATVREAAVRGLAGNEAFNPWPWPQPRPRPFP